MAMSKPLIASLFLFSLFMYFVHTDEMVYKNGPRRSLLQNLDCDALCDARCRLASRQKICKRACGTCCVRCNCVPPGTSGHEDVCLCYANMTTHGGRHKCP